MELPVPTKIAVVDDHNLFRKGLIRLIDRNNTDNRYTILFEADNGNEMKDRLSKKSPPDIIMMDIHMPDMDGYAAVAWLKKYYPKVSILVISMFDSPEPVLRMVKMGIMGYLSKDIEVEDMHNALESITKGKPYFPSFVSNILADNLQQGNPSAEQEISEAEREFIKLASTNMNYVEIADKMNLSGKTIDGYRDGLFKKMKVKNRTAMVVYAIRHGIIKP